MLTFNIQELLSRVSNRNRYVTFNNGCTLRTALLADPVTWDTVMQRSRDTVVKRALPGERYQYHE